MTCSRSNHIGAGGNGHERAAEVLPEKESGVSGFSCGATEPLRDLDDFLKAHNLSRYAPCIARVHSTGASGPAETPKAKKQALFDEAIDLERIGPLYVYAWLQRAYVRITSPQELVTEHL